MRAWRWHYLFPAHSRPPGLVPAIMIGYMVNNVLPLRAGEVVRVYAVARRWPGHFWTVAATRQLLPVFYAMGDVRTPVVVSALDLVAFIVAAVTLKGPLGHVGISVAVSASSAVQMLLLWFGLRRRLPSLRLGEIGASAARTAASSVVATAAGYALAASSARAVLADRTISWAGRDGPDGSRGGASSSTTCALVPPTPNELTPARRGVGPAGHSLDTVLT